MASVLVFCVQCALMSICLDPTHLVTCLLINFPQLLSLITLLICSLYNLLMFAVPCWFIVVYCVPCVLSSLFQLCPALPSSQSLFPLRGCFCLFYLLLLIKSQFPPAIGSSHSSLPPNLTIYLDQWFSKCGTRASSSGTQMNLRIKYKSGRVSTKAIFF